MSVYKRCDHFHQCECPTVEQPPDWPLIEFLNDLVGLVEATVRLTTGRQCTRIAFGTGFGPSVYEAPGPDGQLIHTDNGIMRVQDFISHYNKEKETA